MNDLSAGGAVRPRRTAAAAMPLFVQDESERSAPRPVGSTFYAEDDGGDYGGAAAGAASVAGAAGGGRGGGGGIVGGRAETGEGGEGDAVLDLKVKARKPRRRSSVESVAWLIATACILVYGDGKRHFVQAVLSDPRVARQPFFVACLCVFINSCIFFHLAVVVRHIRKDQRHFDTAAPGAISSAALLGVLAFILFSVALWPIWGVLILPILWTFFMAFVIIAAYLPPYKPKSDDDVE